MRLVFASCQSAAADNACRVDAAQVRFLRVARTRREHMYREAGGILVRPRVVAFLNGHAAPLLKSGYDDSTGMESCRVHDRVVAVRDAITAASDGVAARELSERVEDVIGVPM
jgi:hypothetical protein